MNDQRIIDEIRQEISDNYLNNVFAIYGFGSFFRSANYKDIDLIVVSNTKIKDELSLYRELLNDLGRIANKYSVLLDLTYLKFSEFNNAPILERESLVEIYKSEI